MQSLTANDLHVNLLDFASRLHYWAYHGFPELGDTRGFVTRSC